MRGASREPLSEVNLYRLCCYTYSGEYSRFSAHTLYIALLLFLPLLLSERRWNHITATLSASTSHYAAGTFRANGSTLRLWKIVHRWPITKPKHRRKNGRLISLRTVLAECRVLKVLLAEKRARRGTSGCDSLPVLEEGILMFFIFPPRCSCSSAKDSTRQCRFALSHWPEIAASSSWFVCSFMLFTYVNYRRPASRRSLRCSNGRQQRLHSSLLLKCSNGSSSLEGHE